ncbi:MAG: cell division protein ZapA, partial [Thermoanaerobaculia bacterium]
MTGKRQPVSVEIYGQTYNVRGEGDPAYLTELAQIVDSRMREIAPQ